MKKLFFLSVLFFSVIVTYSQDKISISGYIKDSAGQAVPFASVYLYKDTFPNPIKFTITKSDGKYTLLSPAGNMRIEVKAVGYKVQSFLINEQNNKDATHNFLLQKDSKLLEDVTVNVIPPIVKHGDTTTFDAASFKNASQQNIEDLIKNMPGFKVESDGQLYYKGKYISKALVEGDDMYGRNYAQLTKGFSPEKVSQIQVIENFTDEEDILSANIHSTETVINIKFGDAKIKTTGTVAGSIGVPAKRMDNMLNLLSIQSKVKAIIIGGNNTVGKLLPPVTDKTKYGVDLFNRKYLTDIPEISSASIPSEYSNDNKSYNASASILARPIPSLLLRYKTIVSSDSYTQAQSDLTTIRDTSFAAYSISDSNSFYKKNTVFLQEAEINYRLHNKFQVIYTIDKIINHTDISTNGITNGLPQNSGLKKQDQPFHQTIRMNYIITNHLSARVDFAAGTSPSKNTFSTNTNILQTAFSLPDSITQIAQYVNNPINGYKLNAQIIQKQKRGSLIYYTNFTFNKNLFQSNQHGISDSNYIYDTATFTANNTQLKQYNNTIGVQKKFILNNGGYINISFPINYTKEKFEILGGNNENNYTYLSPEVNALVKLNSTKSLLFNYKLDNELNSTYNNLPNKLIANYTTLYSSNLPAFISTSHTVSASYIFTNFRSNKYVISYLSLQYNSSAVKKITATSIDRLVTENYLQPYRHSNLNNITLYYYLSKVFTEYKLQGEATILAARNQSLSLTNDSLIENKVDLSSINLKLKTLFTGKFNFIYEPNFSVTNSKQIIENGNTPPAINTWQMSNKLTAFIKVGSRINIVSAYNFLSLSQYKKSATNIQLWNVQTIISVIPQKLTAKFGINNILNKKSVRFTDISADNLFISTSSYSLIPRFMLLRLEYNF